MEQPDYRKLSETLYAAGDRDVARLARMFDAVFRSSKFRPRDETAPLEDDLIAAVRDIFPTPFARSFLDGWQTAEDEYEEALARSREPSPDVDQRSRAEAVAKRRLFDTIMAMWSCWLQIVHFLPFILMAALRRLDDDTLKEHAAKELAQAFHYYKTFYEKAQDERRREADQLHLLVFLNKLFRRLSTKGLLDESFLLAPVLPSPGAGYSDIFPERFDAAMRLLLQARNVVIHGQIYNRPEEITGPIYTLMKWSFLDVIAVLAPICRAFSLSYVAGLVVGARDTAFVEVEALDFSGYDGPREARYRVTSAPQFDEYALVDLRLYLIARARQMGAAEEQVLQPPDYLDLTPFIITDRLRVQAARPATRPADRRRILFALQLYFEPLRELLFSELGGAEQRMVPTAGSEREARLLLETIDRFKARASRLTAQITLGGRHANAEAVRSQLWSISKEHLATLVDTRCLDERGRSIESPTRSGPKSIYDPGLYVDPPEGLSITEFLQGSRRGMILVGASGLGKSNLLAHHHLARLRDGGLSVFLSARQFDTASFREMLATRVAKQISLEWQTLAALDGFLDENGETLAIFVDALNEYSGPSGPVALLSDMIVAIAAEPALQRCKIVASCRSETWTRYCQERGGENRLDPAVFHAPAGDAIRTDGFKDRQFQSQLYAAYQGRYALEPKSYEALPEPLQSLVAQPFMMALVAEIYGNRDGSPGRLPGDLDYYTLFQTLTERKKADARILLPASDIVGREQIGESIAELCRLLARMIFERLVSDDPLLADATNRDALPIDVVNKSFELQSFVRGGGTLSVLEIALQIGLLDQIKVPQRNREGRLVTSSAFAFFHDQYTQFWLASAYQQGILGWLDHGTLGDAAKLAALQERIANVILRSLDAPVLAGALDHWLQKNLEIFHDRKLAPAIPLLNGLARHEFPAVRFQAVALTTHLLLRRYLSPEELYAPIFRTGSARLRSDLAQAFAEFWGALPAQAARAFIDACDPEEDANPLRQLGEIFALRLSQSPREVVDYLGDAVSPLTIATIAEPRRFARQFRFSLQFAIFSVMTCFDQPEATTAVREFFRSKYRPIVDFLASSEGRLGVASAAKRVLRKFLFARFDAFGVEQWNRFIGPMETSGNDQFFADDNGVVQRDVLAEFLPYMIDLHNGDLARLTLAGESPFRALMLKMLDYRVMSIIGYNATLCLPSVLVRQDFTETERFVLELVARRTPAALFYGNLLLANLAYTDASRAGPALTLMHERIVPMLLEESLPFDWSIIFSIAALDVERHWTVFEKILDRLFEHFEAAGDADACAAFGDILCKVCYCHDMTLGRRVIEKLARRQDRFLGPLWQDCTLKVFAAMLTRNAGALRSILAAEALGEAALRQSRQYQSDEIVKQSALFPLQVDLNRFLAWLYVAEPRLRHAVVKYFIGSLATGDSISDFAAGVRQTLVAFINVFFGERPEDAPHGELSLNEIRSAMEAARR